MNFSSLQCKTVRYGQEGMAIQNLRYVAFLRDQAIFAFSMIKWAKHL